MMDIIVTLVVGLAGLAAIVVATATVAFLLHTLV